MEEELICEFWPNFWSPTALPAFEVEQTLILDKPFSLFLCCQISSKEVSQVKLVDGEQPNQTREKMQINCAFLTSSLSISKNVKISMVLELLTVTFVQEESYQAQEFARLMLVSIWGRGFYAFFYNYFTGGPLIMNSQLIGIPSWHDIPCGSAPVKFNLIFFELLTFN